MVLASPPKTSPNPHHRKRHGQHHKVSKHYRKTYWPYLPMLLLVVVGIAINAVWSSPAKVLDYATNVSDVSLLQETNIQRTQQSLGALALNSLLSQAAQDKANDMAARDYWAHVTPEGKQPWQFMSAVGYSYTLAGENLAYGFATSSDTVAGWMNSAGHRANILKAGYKEVGFGIANSPNYQGTGPETIIVAMYAAPAKAAAPVAKAAPAQTATPAPTPTPAAEAAPVPTPTPAPEPTPRPTTTQAPPSTEEADRKAEAATQQLTSKPVSRIDVLTDGNAQWAALTVSVLVTLGAISLVYRHGKMWRRYIIEGEHFLIKHPLYDIAIVAAVVVSIILTRTSGVIH